LFSEICAIMQARAAGKGLEFAFVQSTAIPTAIQCDRTLLLKCLLSLADSAITRTEDGYVHIKVSVQDDDDGSSISFDFVDSSPSTSLKEAGEMFKPFSADRPTDKLFASGGMELAICSALSEVMAGTLSVAKNPGRGLVISLVIPTGVDMVAVELLTQAEPEEVLCDEFKTG
jgi:signal transduction histidine kinase